MSYYLLTGSTGLLGSNLLRDFLTAGLRVAVLVRPTKFESPSQRIESIMTRWDKRAGRTLPRPVILEGDLNNDRFSLDDTQLAWVSEHCHALVQNAASVTYFGKYPDEEPWRTNVGGTRNALEFCRRIGVRQFHHVSTAYLCGQRKGRVYEVEVGHGQELNTDYERSKLEGEKLVRGADHIDPPTIYRPAIIVGDSRTGHTTTFHAFYVPLKLIHMMFSRITRDDFKIDPLLEAIRIKGHERKNLVPVDWISTVMTHILTHPQHHGQTYHLAPERPVTTGVMRDSMIQAFLVYGDQEARAEAQTGEGWSFNWEEFVDYFKGQMSVYESYWNDDPEFDLTNTNKAAPHLSCPDVNAEMLMRLCKYAIESNFGWPRPAPIQLEVDVHKQLAKLMQQKTTPANTQRVGLQVNGPGGGQWELLVEGGRALAARPGITSPCTAQFYLNTNTFARLQRREITLDQSLHTAQTLIQGEKEHQKELAEVLEQIVLPQDSIPN